MIRALLALAAIRLRLWRLRHAVPLDNGAGYSRLDELEGLGS